MYTYRTLRKCGYTGPIRLVVDNEDKTVPEYQRRYPGEVVVFDKIAVAQRIDEGDNFSDRRAIIYARNASFGITGDLGFQYFIQLDDDYMEFSYTWKDGVGLLQRTIKQLDNVFDVLLRYYESIPALSIAFAQRGDFIGGNDGKFLTSLRRRKCMNSFICSVDRPFEFFGRMNEDVNVYTHLGGRGGLLMTMSMVSLNQKETQKNAGGMSDIYLDQGTYVKSFYTVMYSPSCVKIAPMKSVYWRIHHEVRWKNAVPQIVREKYRKGDRVREYGPECPEEFRGEIPF